MTYDWLLFDADGTLFDYEAAERQALARTWADYGLTPTADALPTYQEVNGELWRALERGETTPEQLKVDRFARLFSALELGAGAPDPVGFSDRYLSNLGACTDLMPGAEALLQRLVPPIGLALITNGLTKVQRSRLTKSGLAPLFKVVVISEEEGVAKPDPGIFAIALARMGNPPKARVLMIGDSLTSDMRGASRFGIDTCWYNPAGKPRDPEIDVTYEIHALHELLPLVKAPVA